MVFFAVNVVRLNIDISSKKPPCRKVLDVTLIYRYIHVSSYGVLKDPVKDPCWILFAEIVH